MGSGRMRNGKEGGSARNWNNRRKPGKTGLRRGRLAGAAAVLAAGLLAAGCGQQKGATTAQKEFVYVPEYVKLEIEDNLDQIRVVGDTVYFVSGKWDDASDSYRQYIGRMEVGQTEPEKVSIAIGPDESLSNPRIMDDGSVLALVYTYLYDDAAGADGGTAETAGEPDADGNDAGGEDTAGESDAGGNGTAGEPGAEGDAAGTAASAGARDAEGTQDGDTQEGDTEEGGTGEGGAGDKEDKASGAGDGADAAEEPEDDGEAVSSDETSSTTIINASEGVGVTVSSASYSVGVTGSEEGEEYREPTGRKQEIWKINADGSVAEKISLDAAVGGGEDFYVQYLETDKDGNIYMAYDQQVIVADKTGKKLFELNVDNWINSMYATKDGQVLLTYWSDGIEIHTVDVAGKKIGDKVEGLAPGRYGNCTFSQGAGSDLLVSAENKLYSYNFADAQTQEILNWLDCDIDESDLSSFTVLEDGRVLAITSRWDGESDSNLIELAYLTKKKGSEVPEKKILTYGTVMLNYNVRQQILEFNRTNQEYRIEINEYYVDSEEENAYTNALQRMNSDIVSGKCPDIIDLSSNNMDSYIAKGVVEDLYPFMDKDEEMNREDYLENVLRAYEHDGKLYALPSDFYINTIMAKVSDVGDKQNITLDEVMELAKNIPEDAELYQYATKSSILSSIMRMNMDVFVDWDTGECKFGSEDFIKALEFANTFPAEFNWSEDQPSVPTRIREGKLIMMDVTISSMQEYQMYKGMYGEPVAFVGYPSLKESGSCIVSNGSLLAMSAKSPYQDGVWQFIRARLTKEAQEKEDRYRYGFPVMKSALEKMFEADMEEEYYDGPDGKVKQPKTTWGYDDFQIEIYAATEEEVAAVRKLIESTDTSFQYDMQMYAIIEEESAPFFEGQKSAKEVADIIQSRVQIYVNENR